MVPGKAFLGSPMPPYFSWDMVLPQRPRRQKPAQARNSMNDIQQVFAELTVSLGTWVVQGAGWREK